MTISLLINALVFQFINTIPNNKLLGYSYLDQLKDVLPSLLLSLIMGITVYCVTYLCLGNWITLLLQVAIGIVIYALGSCFFHIESFDYLKSSFARILHYGKMK